jgi:hypothetical protein
MKISNEIITVSIVFLILLMTGIYEYAKKTKV